MACALRMGACGPWGWGAVLGSTEWTCLLSGRWEMGSEDEPQAWSPLCRVEPNTWGGSGSCLATSSPRARLKRPKVPVAWSQLITGWGNCKDPIKCRRMAWVWGSTGCCLNSLPVSHLILHTIPYYFEKKKKPRGKDESVGEGILVQF